MFDFSKNENGLSRRTFLQGGVLAASAAVAGSLIGCSPAPSGGSSKASGKDVAKTSGESRAWSWETAPEPIADGDIVETVETEVVVVGAGVAGLAAACRAKELGLKTIVLERGASISLRGLMFASFDSKLMRKYGVSIDKEAVIADWMKTCGGRPSEELVRMFANRSGEVTDWMIEKSDGYGCGVRLYDGQYKGETHKEYCGTHMWNYDFFENQGINHTPGWMFWMETEGKGVDYYYNMRAEQLVKEGDRVAGVVAKGEKGYVKYLAKKGVVLATGDISGDPEMVEAFAPYSLEKFPLIYMPSGQNTGDGHKMGMWAGGISEASNYQPMLHPLAGSWLQYGFLHLNTQGNRFMNEDTWIQAKSAKVMQQPGADGFAFTIFDSNWPTQLEKTIPVGGGQFWDGMERTIEQPWTPEEDTATLARDIEKGTAFKADSLEELAGLLGVDKTTFLASIERYNALAEAGVDEDFGKNPIMMNTIKQPPFYATKWGPALLVITGGLMTNTKTQVIDAEHKVIPGLYAAGNVAGGRYGVDYPVTINGTSLASAVVWGYVAAETLAEG